MEQPRWDDDVATWRRFAGHLRQRVGDADRRAVDAERRAAEAERRASEAESSADRSRASARRNRWHITRIEKLLSAGDVPAAVDLLAERRSYIDERALRRQAARSHDDTPSHGSDRCP